MTIDLGSGASAKCVLSPPLNCFKKFNDSYISKVTEIDRYGRDNHTVMNEIEFSKYIYSKANKKIINKYFALIDDFCRLKGIDFKDKDTKKKCKVNDTDEYLILYSKNGGCKTLKKNDKILYNNKEVKLVNEYENSSDIKLDEKIINVDKKHIERVCGELFESSVTFNCFKNETLLKKQMKHLLNGIKFLNNHNIIHSDIKLENIIANDKGKIKIIDFGGTINLNLHNNLINNILLEYSRYKKINDYYINSLNNIILTYTHGYIAPEIFIFTIISKYKHLSLSEIYMKVKSKLEMNTKYDDKLYQIISDIYNNFYEFVIDLFCKQKKSQIFKYDIYSLGITFNYILYNLKHKNIIVNNSDLEDLIMKMIDIDYKKRITIDECLKHSFFKTKKMSKNKKVKTYKDTYTHLKKRKYTRNKKMFHRKSLRNRVLN